MRKSGFWRLYTLSSVCSAGLSVLLFHWFDQSFRQPYETSAVLAGLLTLPINWLTGEQLTWPEEPAKRLWRALMYFSVYGIGLLIDAWVVHVIGHVARADGRLADALGVILAMSWTAPMNRYFTWRQSPVNEFLPLPHAQSFGKASRLYRKKEAKPRRSTARMRSRHRE